MAQLIISSLQNHINSQKQALASLEQQKLRAQSQYDSRAREICAEGDRAMATMATPGPIVLDLLRQSVQLKDRFTQEKANLDSEITTLKRNLEMKEDQLRRLQNIL